MGDRKACERAFASALRQPGRSVIVDRCNFDSRQRSTWIRMARESQRPVKLIAVQLLIDLPTCIQRVHSRKDHPTLDGTTGERVCRQFFQDFELVHPSEGFHEVLTARNPSDVATITQILIRNTQSAQSQSGLPPHMPLTAPPPPPNFFHLFADPACPKGPYDSHYDSSPVLLFDLNGTLTSLTEQRRAKKRLKLRPAIQRLMELKQAGFKLGIYTSAMTRTAKEAFDMIEAACGGVSPFEPGLILHRDHTKPYEPQAEELNQNPNEFEDPSLKRKRSDHDTVKPLSPYFSRLQKVLLIDDDAHKSCKGEERNLVLIPAWLDDEDPSCTALSSLVDTLLEVGVGASDLTHHQTYLRDRVQGKPKEVNYYLD